MVMRSARPAGRRGRTGAGRDGEPHRSGRHLPLSSHVIADLVITGTSGDRYDHRAASNYRGTGPWRFRGPGGGMR